jgi:hypothetical protein
MDKLMKNKLAMYKTLKTVIAEHQAEWSGLPAFSTSYAAFTSRLTALEQSAYQQNLALIGVSAVKNAKKAIVAEKTYAMSSAMVAFAVVNNDVELINQMKINKHDLHSATRDFILVLVDRVISRATELVGQLNDYGVDQVSIDELQLLRDELDAQMNAPRNAMIGRKGETSRIKSLRKELDAIIKFQLDKLMVILKEEHPDFFMAYNNARIVVDYKNRSAGMTEVPPEVDDGE